jgi:hypothetical protein
MKNPNNNLIEPLLALLLIVLAFPIGMLNQIDLFSPCQQGKLTSYVNISAIKSDRV